MFEEPPYRFGGIEIGTGVTGNIFWSDKLTAARDGVATAHNLVQGYMGASLTIRIGLDPSYCAVLRFKIRDMRRDAQAAYPVSFYHKRIDSSVDRTRPRLGWDFLRGTLGNRLMVTSPPS